MNPVPFRVIALETSGAVGNICLAENDLVVVERAFARGMEHGRMLVPALEEACRAVGWDPRRDISLIAVSQGPGSFTGLRIGVAAAKTIAYVSGCPVAGVSSLEALAHNSPPDASRACAVLDAKRGQVYAALFERENNSWQRRAPDLLLTPRLLLERIGAPAYIIGDGLAAYPEAFSAAGFTIAPENDWQARAAIVAHLGLERYRRGETIPYRDLAPIYHRLPEAEERRLRAQGQPAR